jgi:hypothetical protein
MNSRQHNVSPVIYLHFYELSGLKLFRIHVGIQALRFIL